MKLAATVKYGGKTMQVSVRDNNVDQALRALKKSCNGKVCIVK